MYGQLSSSKLKDGDTKIDNLVYVPLQNIDTVFNKIQEIQDQCTLLKNPKTAYLIGIFVQILNEWNTQVTTPKNIP